MRNGAVSDPLVELRARLAAIEDKLDALPGEIHDYVQRVEHTDVPFVVREEIRKAAEKAAHEAPHRDPAGMEAAMPGNLKSRADATAMKDELCEMEDFQKRQTADHPDDVMALILAELQALNKTLSEMAADIATIRKDMDRQTHPVSTRHSRGY